MTQKVVHLVYSFGCGGLEKVIVNVIDQSANYDVEHIVVSLTDEISMAEQIKSPVTVHSLGKQEGNDLSSHRKLYRLLKEIKPNAVQTYNFGTIEYHLTAKIAGVPIRVHSDHGRGGDHPQGKNKLHNLFRKAISYLIDHYVVVSNDLYQWVANVLAIKPNKLALVFNGVTVEGDVVRTSNSTDKFVTVGRLDNVKNQKLMIEAFALAVKIYPEFSNSCLDIVGDGPLYEELHELINSLELQDKVTLLGYREDIPEILKDADIFVLSSNYEAMPMTILEAMALKTPVICTDVGGISTFISEQEAWFSKPRDIQALAHVMKNVKNNSQSRQQKAEVAHRLVFKQYSVERMVDTYMAMYGVAKIN